MNRSQACIRVDQLLDWQAEEMRTGQCPLCGVRAEHMGDVTDRMRAAQARGADFGGAASMQGFQFLHEDDCQLADVVAKVTQLSGEFGIPLENAFITVVIEGKETKVRTVRRVVREGDSPRPQRAGTTSEDVLRSAARVAVERGVPIHAGHPPTIRKVIDKLTNPSDGDLRCCEHILDLDRLDGPVFATDQHPGVLLCAVCEENADEPVWTQCAACEVTTNDLHGVTANKGQLLIFAKVCRDCFPEGTQIPE